jgi:hypothetical protein
MRDMSPLTKRVAVAVVALGLIAVLRFKPWQARIDEGEREKLTVGFLPVT